jgi:acyl-coenzyme A thioesterase PaaI-like protein
MRALGTQSALRGHVAGRTGDRPAAYTINLLAPAAGQRFTVTGQVVRAGRTLTVCRGEAFSDGASTPFAIMQATMTAIYGRPGIQH